jgi:hypothetical protein
MGFGPMSTPKEWVESYPGVPQAFIGSLFDDFSEQVEAWYVQDWEKVGLKAGKLAEAVYSILDGLAAGAFQSRPFKPSNFVTACTQLEKHTGLARSLRIQIPRVLIGIYELRNNRSVGHVGSPVRPNALDGEYFFRASKWTLCELSRALCEANNVAGAEDFYLSVNMSELPLIWDNDDVVRVLRPDLTAGEKTLVVLAHVNQWVHVDRLRNNVEYRNPTDYKRKVLRPLHDKKLIEFDETNDRVIALPPGLRRARTLHS